MLGLPRIPIGHEQGNGGFAKHALMRRLWGAMGIIANQRFVLDLDFSEIADYLFL